MPSTVVATVISMACSLHQGQRIELLVIPEVLELIHTHVGLGEGKTVEAHKADYAALGGPQDPRYLSRLFRDVSGWLVVNSMRSEKVQFNLLCEQTVGNVWRKEAFAGLVTERTHIGLDDKSLIGTPPASCPLPHPCHHSSINLSASTTIIRRRPL